MQAGNSHAEKDEDNPETGSVQLTLDVTATDIQAAGSLVGSFLGSRLLGLVPDVVLLPLLSLLLLLSSIKVWPHT
jgi:uncharacterized membrane protein YfcA